MFHCFLHLFKKVQRVGLNILKRFKHYPSKDYIKISQKPVIKMHLSNFRHNMLHSDVRYFLFGLGNLHINY